MISESTKALSNRPPALRLHPEDHVATAVRSLEPGEPVLMGIAARGVIPRGHKVAIADIEEGAPVRKFGQIIGLATTPIAAGEHVHVHNLAFTPSGAGHAIGTDRQSLKLFPESEAATFEGIVRSDGRVATRNYIGILTTVNCAATVARVVGDQFRSRNGLLDYPNVDGVVALTHKAGCNAGTEGEAIALLRRTIAGYARHANFAAVLIIGLGCESNEMSELVKRQGLDCGERLHTLNIQDKGGTRSTVEYATGVIRELLPEANRVFRQTVSAKHLTVGLQCGGSDGFSAITANPALGFASDVLVRHGGTSILSETPEIYGAEDVLLRRAASPEVGQKLLDLLRWWESYAEKHGETLDNNPSPGNKAGGLTTILEKSLGAAAKGGTADLVGVYRFAEPVIERGFVFMDTPGYDPVSVTGQVAGGANLICFTTGRGSCFGCKPVPSIKLATNSDMFHRMRDDMDLNCGDTLDGGATIEEMGERIFRLMLEVASGRKSQSEELDYGADEFAPWHFGATL
jgi:altronate hydrolase